MHDDRHENPNPEAEHDGPGDSRASLPAMALGALDSDEVDAVATHLAGSSDAQSELEELEAVVGSLGLAAKQVDPPPELRDRILAATQPLTEPVQIEDIRVTRLSPAVWITSLAAAIALFALGAVAFNQWSTAQDRADEIEDLQAQLANQDERIAELEEAAAAAGAFVDFEQPLIWTALATTNEQGPSPGFLARTEDGRTAYLVLTGVAVDPNQVFQAWLIEDTPVPVGTLRPSESGMGFLILEHRGAPVQDFSLIGVTVEPPGGSPQPTSDPVIVAEIV